MKMLRIIDEELTEEGITRFIYRCTLCGEILISQRNDMQKHKCPGRGLKHKKRI